MNRPAFRTDGLQRLPYFVELIAGCGSSPPGILCKTIHPIAVTAYCRFPALRYELDILHRLDVLGGITFHGDDSHPGR